MIKFNCGCGFRTDNEVAAVHHVQGTQHTVIVQGQITYKEVWTPKEVHDGQC